jgi:hypothetical protein
LVWGVHFLPFYRSAVRAYSFDLLLSLGASASVVDALRHDIRRQPLGGIPYGFDRTDRPAPLSRKCSVPESAAFGARLVAFSKANIGIRTQAGILLVVMALWSASLLMVFCADDLNVFWYLVLVLSPFVILFLGAIFLFSYISAGRPHLWWVRVAATATVVFCLLSMIGIILALVPGTYP